eukprot:NODE_393_length_9450_cov_0.506791.p7 type:complete len:114 gc:universal NODE_393_length_9450_cov_0.506791:7426-7767(+)
MPLNGYDHIESKNIKQIGDNEDCLSDDLHNDFDLDEFEMFEEDHTYDTPLDHIDPYLVFGHTIHVLIGTRKPEYDEWMRLLNDDIRTMIEKLYELYVTHLHKQQQIQQPQQIN